MSYKAASVATNFENNKLIRVPIGLERDSRSVRNRNFPKSTRSSATRWMLINTGRDNAPDVKQAGRSSFDRSVSTAKGARSKSTTYYASVTGEHSPVRMQPQSCYRHKRGEETATTEHPPMNYIDQKQEEQPERKSAQEKMFGSKTTRVAEGTKKSEQTMEMNRRKE